MSQENIEVVRSMVDSWNTGEGEEWLTAFHPDVEFVDRQAGIGMRDRGRGLEELRRAVEQWTEIFDDFRIEVLELVDIRGDYVLGHTRFEGVGHDSGISVSNTQIDVYRVVDGKILEYHAGFDSRAQAVEAVGLAE